MVEDFSTSLKAMIVGLIVCLTAIVLLLIMGLVFNEFMVYALSTSAAVAIMYVVTNVIFNIAILTLESRGKL